ncbi:M28 family metallopeptidase [Aliidiomarina celeris]|uniref:M28 family metallopeptidase n=1 Tax=Aliidiomarina celeris TaxID=2249428 RepID=UPI000DE8A8F4|nr:M28 family metallopeptidase [Aliidiomarina celeris]
MKLKLLITAVVVAVTAVACSPAKEDITPIKAEANRIQAHLEFLANDLLEGRDSGKRGHEIAAAYIEAQFKALGLKPAGTDGYYQRVPLRTARLVPDSAKFTLHDGDNNIEMPFPRAFLSSPSTLSEHREVTAPLVFVGYGIVSDEFDIDDYAGLDVEGSIVVMLAGRPDFLPSEEAAHINSIKTELAVERGAVGIISVHTPKAEEVVPFDVRRMYARSPRVRWLNSDGVPHGEYEQIKGSALVHYEEADALFARSDISLERVWEQMAADEMPTGAPLNLSASLSVRSTFEEIDSPNVIAMLEGSNPDVNNEVILYTAHADHIGVLESFSEEKQINNGAMDNASGVAVMLETARMFVEAGKQGQPLGRSIMFAAVTAEERGLLGADYFANNPTVPVENIVANVNLDMPVLLYDFADVVAFGSNHSSLGHIVADAAELNGIKLSEDPMPEQALFTRSDHYALVKQGIPAVFLMTGFESKNENEDGGEIWGQFFAEHYHRPGDDLATLNEKFGGIRYEAGAAFTQINYDIGRVIANDRERPSWHPESYFGRVFAGGEGSIRH